MATSKTLPRPGPSLLADNRPAMELDEALDQREADAEATFGALQGRLRLDEHVEDRRRRPGRQPDAVV